MPEARKVVKASTLRVPVEAMSLDKRKRDVCLAVFLLAWKANQQRFTTTLRELSRESGVPKTSLRRVLNSGLDRFLDHNLDHSKKRDSLEITLASWPYDLAHGSRAETSNGPSKKRIKYLEKDFIGNAPSIGNEPLPAPLEELFASQKKEQCYPNIWLTEDEYFNLAKQYGRFVVDEAAKHLAQWSWSLKISIKGVPHWVSYRQSRDHAKLLSYKCQKLLDEANV